MEDPLFSVADQVVLVSGGSRGIGRALAAGFVERQARVVIAGREEATLAQTAEAISTGAHPVTYAVCDVAREEDVHRLVEGVERDCGRIDTLLNVAGVNKRAKVEDYTLAEFDWILGINLRGAFAVAQAVGRGMIARRSGSIVNIDSLNTYAPLKGVGPYAMSKAGLGMMTRSLASEWGEHGVRVNAIAPGFFPTTLSAPLWRQQKMVDWAHGITPLGKLGEVADLVGAAVFLASRAAAFVTGQTLRVDGGASAGLRWPIDL
ncbi:MAG: SDR family oxidoreductase [Candidatus Latescibacterota bacterium]|jgi:NAD(P)-dependent dehydrogenase (short-subunit alcohol dehydrogenase family)